MPRKTAPFLGQSGLPPPRDAPGHRGQHTGRKYQTAPVRASAPRRGSANHPALQGIRAAQQISGEARARGGGGCSPLGSSRHIIPVQDPGCRHTPCWSTRPACKHTLMPRRRAWVLRMPTRCARQAQATRGAYTGGGGRRARGRTCCILNVLTSPHGRLSADATTDVEAMQVRECVGAGEGKRDVRRRPPAEQHEHAISERASHTQSQLPTTCPPCCGFSSVFSSRGKIFFLFLPPTPRACRRRCWRC